MVLVTLVATRAVRVTSMPGGSCLRGGESGSAAIFLLEFVGGLRRERPRHALGTGVVRVGNVVEHLKALQCTAGLVVELAGNGITGIESEIVEPRLRAVDLRTVRHATDDLERERPKIDGIAAAVRH